MRIKKVPAILKV